MGARYATLTMKKSGEKLSLLQTVCPDAASGGEEVINATIEVPYGPVTLKVDIEDSARCSFSYSVDGTTFSRFGADFVARPEEWIGAKLGLFCVLPPGAAADSGETMDMSWFRIEPLR